METTGCINCKCYKCMKLFENVERMCETCKKQKKCKLCNVPFSKSLKQEWVCNNCLLNSKKWDSGCN